MVLRAFGCTEEARPGLFVGVDVRCQGPLVTLLTGASKNGFEPGDERHRLSRGRLVICTSHLGREPAQTFVPICHSGLSSTPKASSQNRIARCGLIFWLPPLPRIEPERTDGAMPSGLP